MCNLLLRSLNLGLWLRCVSKHFINSHSSRERVLSEESFPLLLKALYFSEELVSKRLGRLGLAEEVLHRVLCRLLVNWLLN